MGIANCNKRTYPGSQISKMFTLGPDKTRYTTNHGITPNFYEILKANVNLADFYFISIDESMNSITPINQMDFLIRYWDSEANLVRVRFWNSSYLGQGTHKDVLEKSENSPTGLNPSKMIQVSMDGPSFNLKFLESLCNLRESEGIPGLIDIGVCQLHTMHGAFEIGAVKSAWNIYKILKAVRQIFHDSPVRRDDYISVTGSTSFSHHFCATRWVKSKGIAERAKSLWEHVFKIVNFWKKLPK